MLNTILLIMAGGLTLASAFVGIREVKSHRRAKITVNDASRATYQAPCVVQTGNPQLAFDPKAQEDAIQTLTPGSVTRVYTNDQSIETSSSKKASTGSSNELICH